VDPAAERPRLINVEPTVVVEALRRDRQVLAPTMYPELTKLLPLVELSVMEPFDVMRSSTAPPVSVSPG